MLHSAYGISLLSFLLVAGLSPVLIRGLRFFNLTQPIRSQLSAEQQMKRGTPLMAGLIFFTGVAVCVLSEPNRLTLLLGSVFLLFSLVGFIDDYKKAAYQDPEGISGKTKLVLQFTFTGILLYSMFQGFGLTTDILFFGGELHIMPVVFIGAALLFVVGSANAINFTDGMDGLLIVTAIPTYFFFFVITDKWEVEAFSLAMVACLLGLLIYNIYPAKAFMGDTGSMAIGGSLAFLAVLERVEIIVPLLFFVYFAEQISVILQVWYYKRTRLRLFRMAPIHYHFNLKYGWNENRIVFTSGLISTVGAILSFIIWKWFLHGA